MSDETVAVVFVHGIGAQPASTTLSGWAVPIIETLRNWTGLAETPVGIAATSLTSGDRDWAETTVTVPEHDNPRDESGNRGEVSIYMTEAWWSESFIPQRSMTVLGWTVLTAAKAIGRPLRHLRRMAWYSAGDQFLSWCNVWDATRERKKWNRIGAYLLLLLYGLGLIVSTFTIVPLLTIAMIPIFFVGILVAFGAFAIILGGSRIPVVGKYVQPVANALVGSVGDASAWSTDSLTAAAMRRSVHTAITRAEAHSAKVVVVAHSQGAAICADLLFGYQTEDGNRHEKVVALVTVGGATSLLARETDIVHNWSERTHHALWVNIWALWDPVPSGPVGARNEESYPRLESCTSPDLSPG